LTITTNVASTVSAESLSPGRSNGKPLLGAFLLGAFGLLGFSRVRRLNTRLRPAQHKLFFSLLFLILGFAALAGCGGNSHPSSKTPAGTSAVTVTASGGGQTNTTQLSLTVQ